ncbi:PIG-L family deacetylase [Candidatus Chloroploca sp. M-50]|uniref:PIG-L family deacetylase n=1 Tax=Candidatus Chloroploca mongolica TaxID=2528176 RepID=A0ABS4D3Z3_9CHLR|nr:PIG-L family deacetylase [Candidatus Chloroploca mongolica]
MTRRSLMVILAHPDDEGFSIGGTLAAYAAQGHQGLRRGGSPRGPALLYRPLTRDDCGVAAPVTPEPHRSPDP